MASQPPRPPRTRPAVKVAPEHLVGVAMLAGMVTTGAIRDLEDTLLSVGRIAAIYFFLTAAFRLIGKRELSSLSPLELITLMLVPEIASGTLNGDQPLVPALVGISALLLIVFSVSLLSARFKLLEDAVEPPPRVLVVDGAMCQDAMARERISPDELFAEMHKHGIAELEQVQWAILESGGDIAFVRRDRASASAPASHRSLA